MAMTRKPPKKQIEKPVKKPAVAKSARAAGKTVDDYVGALEASQRTLITELCALVDAAAPDATCSIKWGQPVWEDHGPFAYVRAASKYITFGFWRGTMLSDPRGLLEGEGGMMRHVKLSTTELPRAALLAFVREAVKLNRKHGTPTSKRG